LRLGAQRGETVPMSMTSSHSAQLFDPLPWRECTSQKDNVDDQLCT
jgi:hypothetical protein